jgi:hypothetical protein
MKVKPITPDEVVHEIPDVIIEVVNTLIKENWNGQKSHILQEEILERLPIPRDEVFEKHLLDFEHIYREAGWNVIYDKPGWDEKYKAFFEFTKK